MSFAREEAAGWLRGMRSWHNAHGSRWNLGIAACELENSHSFDDIPRLARYMARQAASLRRYTTDAVTVGVYVLAARILRAVRA